MPPNALVTNTTIFLFPWIAIEMSSSVMEYTEYRRRIQNHRCVLRNIRVGSSTVKKNPALPEAMLKFAYFREEEVFCWTWAKTARGRNIECILGLLFKITALAPTGIGHLSWWNRQ